MRICRVIDLIRPYSIENIVFLILFHEFSLRIKEAEISQHLNKKKEKKRSLTKQAILMFVYVMF